MSLALNDSADALVIFTKAPVLGQVKTRLARAIGDAAALAAHITLVEDTLGRLAHHFGRTQLCVSDDSQSREDPKACNNLVREWAESFGLEVASQHGVDLGARMYNAFEVLFSQGISRVVLVGTDCPGIDAVYVEQAFSQLSTSDLVFGPAEDGGYGLIGMQAGALHAAAPIFGDLPWGSSTVLEVTRSLLSQAQLKWSELAPIWDVDECSDWQRYQDLVNTVNSRE